MSTIGIPVVVSAISVSPRLVGGIAGPLETEGAIGPNDAVASFTKVLSEHSVGKQNRVSQRRTPINEADHPTGRAGRKKNHASKGADLKRSTLEAPAGVSPAPIQEVPRNVNLRTAVASLKGSGDVADAGRAKGSLDAAIPAQASAKLESKFVKSQWAEPDSGGSPTGEVAAVAEASKGGGSSKIGAVEVSNTPLHPTSIEALKASVIASVPGMSGVSVLQTVSDLAQRAAAPTDSGMAAIATTDASKTPLAPSSGGATKEIQISENPFPLSGESLPTRAGAMDRSVSGGLASSIPMPAESARPATSGRALRSSTAGMAMSATAQLNFSQVQKTEGSTAVVGSTGSGSSSASLDVKALSEAISRPLVAGNGSHTIVVDMHPADLGRLEAVVTLDHTALQISLAPQTQAGHVALSHAVDALKSQLAQNGMSVNVTLRDPGSQSGNEPLQYPIESRQVSEVSDDETSSRSSVSSFAAGQLHLVL